MTPSLRQLRAFVAVARAGSFTQAAKALHLSQPALTVQIRQLEDILGVPLFDRNTRSVRLTRIGKDLVPRMERLQEELDAVVGEAQELAAGERGVVRLACIPSFAASALPDAIAAFRARHPNVTFALKDANWGRMMAMVRAEEVDFGIGDMPSPAPDLQFTRIAEDRMQVIYPRGHAIGSLRQVTLAHLAEHAMVMMDRDTSARRTIDEAFATAGCYPPCACEVMYMSTAAAMVRAGLGYAILPASAIEWRAHRGLAARLVDDPAFVRRVGVIRKPGRTLPPVSSAFVEALLAGSREAPATPGDGRKTTGQSALSKAVNPPLGWRASRSRPI